MLREENIAVGVQEGRKPGIISVEELQQKLQEVGLHNVLRVSETADGIIEVQGRLTQSQFSDWDRVAIWYDKDYRKCPQLPLCA